MWMHKNKIQLREQIEMKIDDWQEDSQTCYYIWHIYYHIDR